MMWDSLTAREKIIKARIHLQKEKPFWAYLSLNLKLKETEDVPSAGVDASGNMYYNPDFINNLTLEKVKTVLAHEISHVAYSHLIRKGSRIAKTWNKATDYAVNDILVKNGFVEIPGMLYDSKFSDLASEQIYDKLGDDDDNDDGSGFDEHVYEADDKNGNKKSTKGLSEREIKDIEKDWKNKLTEAYEHARQQGNRPAGIDRIIDDMLEPEVNWKNLLSRYISKHIPFDYTYRRPSKISRALKTVYLPDNRNESIHIVVGIDTSGSIYGEELNQFVSEMNSINNSFQQVTMDIIVCDYEIHDHFTLNNTNKKKLFNLELKGGGGTDMRKVFNKAHELGLNTPRNVLVLFTDGYTPFPEDKPRMNTIFASVDADKDNYPDWGYFVKIEVN